MSPQQAGDRGNPIDISALLGDPRADSPEAATWQAKELIGPYHLLQPLGKGGMGEVWLAEQTEPVRRPVALKLIKAGMDTGEVVARFQSERQALALMDDPTIAKVFDAGSTPQGRPYFAMEYIAGIPITTYCDQHAMTLRQRLELFIQVCEGVQHAHQKAIIHRDLKPSNILVSEVDGKPIPRIIDFGIAKAMSHGLTAETLFTRAGAILGTPAYMSPEQAGSSGADVDTRTDVYSLGVVLYELLVGVRPLDFHDLTFDEVLRRLREDDPPRPSTKLRTLGGQSSVTAQLRGDLDAIALKALEKDRSRRYGSPADLAADIGRFLNNEAVLAVPSSTAYRACKFARRYRGVLVTIGAFALVLIVAAAVSVWQSVLATKQRNRADRAAAVAQAVNDFLQNDLLAQASAANQAGYASKPDPHLEVRTALDRAAARIGGKFNKQPEVEAAIRDTIGQTYMDLGLYPEARTQLERALDLHRRVLGTENPKTLRTISRLGYAAYRQGGYAQAEELYSRALEIQRRVLGRERPDVLSSMHGLANVYEAEGKYPQAEALDSQALDIRRRILGLEHRDTLSSINNLANVYDEEGKYSQAEALYSQNLEIRSRVMGPEHPDTLGSINNLALVYDEQGKYAQAEALHNRALEIKRRVLGPGHPDTLSSMNNLATVYFEQGKYAQAEALHSQTIEISRRVSGAEHRNTLMSMNNLAEDYSAQGKYAEAEALYNQTLEIERRVLGAEHPDSLRSMNGLAVVYAEQGKYAPAEALFTQTLETKRRVLGAEHPETLDALSGAVSMYQREDKYRLAETYATEVLAAWRRALGPESTITMGAAVDLGLVYLSQQKFSEAEPLARAALEFDRKKQPDDWQRFRAESLLGASLAGQRRYAPAEPLLLEGHEGMIARKDRMAVQDRYHLDRAREWLVELYKAWGKPEQAAKWRKM